MKFIHSSLWKIFLGKKYRNCFTAVCILIINFLSAVLEGVSFAFILLAFSAISNTKQAISPLIMQWIPSGNWGEFYTFVFYIILSISMQVLRSAFGYLAGILTSYLSLKIQIDTQKKIFQQIFSFTYPAISEYKIGDLVEYAKNPAIFIPIVLEAANRLLVSSLMIVVVFGMMLFLSVQLTIVAVMLFGFFAFCQKILIKKIMKASENLGKHLSEISHHTVQSLQALRLIHTFHRQKYSLKKIIRSLKEASRLHKQVNVWNYSIPYINEVVNIFLLGIILILSVFVLQMKTESVLPILLTFIVLAHRLASRIQMSMQSLASMAANFGYILRLNYVLETSQNKLSKFGGVALSKFHSEIEFKSVFLVYPNSVSAAISDISFKIQKTSTIAFVGMSGAGKSSILDLLVGLYSPTSGEILIDGIAMRDLDLSKWRNLLGVVSQDPCLFFDSIEENIRFGSGAFTLDQVEEVAKIAGAHDFISQLPQGYKTVVGERGYRLSGGEKQRIALARALLKYPEILLLDEATSNLDSHNEHLIQEALELFRGRKTMLIVAHRLSSVINADVIYVIDKGRIVEYGSHDDLIKNKNQYFYFSQLQSAGCM